MEPCTGDNFDPEVCAVVDPEIDEEEYEYMKVRNTNDTPFTAWMLGPLLHLVAGGASYYETQNVDLAWEISNLANLWLGIFPILWFHEFLAGGRLEEDSLFDNWRAVVWASWLIQLATAGYAFITTRNNETQYPIASTVNFLSVWIGIRWGHSTKIL